MVWLFVLVFLYIIVANIHYYSKKDVQRSRNANRSKPSTSAKYRYKNPSTISDNPKSANGVETSIVAAGAAAVVADSLSEKEGVFVHGSSEFSPPESLNTEDINPATGLPMVDGIGSIDVSGNSYGTSHESMESIIDDSNNFDSFDSFDD